ncbi:MAG: hypothetical protein ACTSXG_04255 [Alphaproteobacteria bacterium]
MARSMPWENSDIEYIKREFLKGKRIKKIASSIGRTPASVNKALTRFGARPPSTRNKGSKMVDIKDLIPSFKKKSNVKFIRRILTNDQEWVSINCVVNYLKKKGFCIATVDKSNPLSKELPLTINNIPANIEKLLILANKLRSKAKQPIFMVPNITLV